MGVEGIGARVARKEDKRFITGRGRYVDDIKVLGLTHAHFVRSPHAHAKVVSIDSPSARADKSILDGPPSRNVRHSSGQSGV